MKIDNCSYRPALRGLNINEATIKYIAEKVPKEDLPNIASAFDIFQKSSRTFNFDSSTGQLVANVTEKNLLGNLHPVARYIEGQTTKRLIYDKNDNLKLFGRWINDKASIADIISECLSSLEGNAYVISKKPCCPTEDYTKRFEEYI